MSPSESNDLKTDDETVKVNTSPVTAAVIQPGEIVDGVYRIEKSIGKGGAGTVYEVEQILLGKRFAMKILHDTYSEVAVRRFQKEAQIAASLEHPNLVRAFHFGQLPDGKPFYIMDLVKGKTLAERLSVHPMSQEDVIAIILPLCFALAYAHEKGLVHRDLKPGNIVLVEDDDKVIPKIIDFGIARLTLAETSESGGLTKTGEVFGTPKYMSPEQCSGQKVDNRSDIYSLGCIIFECLAGDVPFSGENALATIMLHITQAAPTLREVSLGGNFSSDWENFVAKMLEKDPENRYKNCLEVAANLQAIRDGTSVLVEKRPEVKVVANDFFGKNFAASSPIILITGFVLLVATSAALYHFNSQKPITAPKEIHHDTNLAPYEEGYVSALDGVVKEVKTNKTKHSSEADDTNYIPFSMHQESDALLHQGQQYLHDGDLKHAKELFNRSLDQLKVEMRRNSSTSDEEALSIRHALIALTSFYEARAFDHKEHYLEALGSIDSAIKINPSVGNYFDLRSQIYKELDNEKAAIADSKKANSYAAQQTDCDKILKAAMQTNKNQTLTIARLQSYEKTYQKAKSLILKKEWQTSHEMLGVLIRKMISEAEGSPVPVDLTKCSLYYAVIAYCQFRQSEIAGWNQQRLSYAAEHIKEAIRLNGSCAEFYDLSGNINYHLKNFKLANEQRELAVKRIRENGETECGRELRSIISRTK